MLHWHRSRGALHPLSKLPQTPLLQSTTQGQGQTQAGAGGGAPPTCDRVREARDSELARRLPECRLKVGCKQAGIGSRAHEHHP